MTQKCAASSVLLIFKTTASYLYIWKRSPSSALLNKTVTETSWAHFGGSRPFLQGTNMATNARLYQPGHTTHQMATGFSFRDPLHTTATCQLLQVNGLSCWPVCHQQLRIRSSHSLMLRKTVQMMQLFSKSFFFFLNRKVYFRLKHKQL